MSRTATELLVIAAAFAGTTALAALLGAANFGTALTFGELAFVVALMWAMLRRADGS
jgi:hypothetical protein